MDPIWKKLTGELKKQLTRGEVSYADLGRHFEVTRSTVFSWVKGGAEPTLPTVRKVAKYLGYKLTLTE